MNVSAVIVTRGDVDLTEILDSLPPMWERVVVDNSQEPQDYMVYGRYVGAQRAKHDLIYVADDDVVVEEPEALVRAWHDASAVASDGYLYVPNITEIAAGRHVVCNMPQEFRHDFYREHALVGFGGVFHRDAPERAFRKGLGNRAYFGRLLNPEFLRDCDMIFTALTPRVLVDIPKRNLPWCDAPNRLWKDPSHQERRNRMWEQIKQVRDGQ